jgi:hypothetical protein
VFSLRYEINCMNIASINFMFPTVTTSNVGLLEYLITNTSISLIL